MRFFRDILIPVLTSSWLALAGCRGHTSPSCSYDTRFSAAFPGAGDLTSATVTASDSCDAFADGSNQVDVTRSTPGSCQVQVALTNGAVYTFAVTFESIAANGFCAAHISPVDASSPVLVERGRCYAAQDAAVGTAVADAGRDGGADAGTACASVKTGNGVEPILTCGCGPTDPQACSTRCGPEELGTTSVTCVEGVYTRSPFCTFDPAGDYSCYRFPTAGPNPSCPIDGSGANVPTQDGTACTVAHCVLCNSYGGQPGGEYLDARGTHRVGYCVCRPPDSAGHRSWSCADDIDWPCASGC